MIEQPVKVHFPQLPFDRQIPYFEIKDKGVIGMNSPDVNDSCESEPESKCENCFSNLNQLNIMNINGPFIQNQCKKFRKKKVNIKMSEVAQNFQFTFYQIFTTRKKFQKKFVILIHNEICGNLNLRRVNRDETRSIHLYFAHFSYCAERILVYIKNNKNEIIRRLPELQTIMH